jgi:hypothetical protein
MAGSTVTGFATNLATYPVLCGAQVTRTCQANGQWTGTVPLYAACAQQCIHPETNQPVAANSTYNYYTRDSGTAAECAAAIVTSTCQQSSGLFSPVPPATRYASCTVLPDPWLVPSISFTVGSSDSFNLATTLPAGTKPGGVFAVDPSGAALPSGMTLSPAGVLSVGSAAVGSVSGVIFSYTEP